MEYSRCDIDKRCIIKTNDNLVFKKFTLLSTICNKRCIWWILYEKNGLKIRKICRFSTKHYFSKI